MTQAYIHTDKLLRNKRFQYKYERNFFVINSYYSFRVSTFALFNQRILV